MTLDNNSKEYSDKSIEYFTQCISLNPSYQDAYVKKAITLIRQDGRDDEAEEFLKSSLLRFPNSGDLLCAFACLKYFQRSFADAISYFEKARQKSKKFEAIDLFYFGDAYICMGEYKKPEKILEESIRLDNKDPKVYIDLAGCQYELNKLDLAKHHLKRAIKLDENSKRSYDLLAKIYRKQGNIDSSWYCSKQAYDISAKGM